MRLYFTQWSHPVLTRTIDGRKLYTVIEVRDIALHTPVPAWCPNDDDEPWTVLEFRQEEWTRIGEIAPDWMTHDPPPDDFPPDMADEILCWCEQWLADHPNIRCLEYSRVTYQQGSYTKVGSFTMTYSELINERKNNISSNGRPQARGAGNQRRRPQSVEPTLWSKTDGVERVEMAQNQ